MRLLNSGAVVLVVAALCLTCSTGVHAMYAEQAGENDWFWKGVGDVAKAVFHPPSKTLKSVYTLTKDGTTVASIKTKSNDGEIRWKRNFAQGTTDPIVCLAAGESVVVAGSSSGLFTFLSPKDGVPTFTAKLPKTVMAADVAKVGDGEQKEGSAAAFNVKDCTLDEKGTTLTVLLQGGDRSLKTVQVGAEASLDDAEATSRTLPSAIKKVALSQTQVWLQLEAGAIMALPIDGTGFSASGLTVPHTAEHPAYIQTVGPVYTVIKQDDGLLKSYAVTAKKEKGQGFELTSTVITTTKASPGKVQGMTLVGTSAASPDSLLLHETIGEKLELSVGDHITTLPSLARPGLCGCSASVEAVSWHGSHILAAKTNKKGTFEALIKTSDGHLTFVSQSNVSWSRPEGLSMLAAIEFSERKDGDTFGFDQVLLAASTTGRLYAYRTVGPTLLWTADWLAAFLAQGGKVGSAGLPTVKKMEVLANGLLKLLLVVDDAAGTNTQTAAQLFFTVSDGSLSSVVLVPKYSAILGDLIAVTTGAKGAGLSLDAANQATKATESYFYTVDRQQGRVQGYAVAAGSHEVIPTWAVNLRQPFVSVAAGSELGLLTAETLRSFPNVTAKVMEVKSKYGLMKNLVVVGRLEVDEEEDEMPVLHLTAINTLTGAVMGSMKHADVDGEVKLSLVEHYVLYHYLCVRTMRYYVGVWEMFDKADLIITEASLTNPAQVATSAFAKQRKVSSFNNRNPVIAAQTLLFPKDVALMGPAVTLDGIARKTMVFVTKAGEVVGVPLRSLSFGFKEEAFPDPLAHPQKQVVYPSQKILSYSYHVAQPKLLATEPTLLESTSHVVVAGQDIFYTRSSLGKPFDVLNDDFATEPLMIGTLALAVATVVARYFSNSKNLKLAWA